MISKQNLLDFNYQQMRQFFIDIGEKPFRAQQVIQWIHQVGVHDFEHMSNLSKALRGRLAEIAEIRVPEIAESQQSSDGTHKWLIKLACGNSVETVYIPDNQRGTLCISSQVGCALACQFCATGAMGFKRNLKVDEIIGQYLVANMTLQAQVKSPRPITNIVFMGMGEPLLNEKALYPVLDILLDDITGLSKHRVTVSTSGVVPAMKRYVESCDAALAVSLHAPNDALRTKIMPVNAKYSLDSLMLICEQYCLKHPKRSITFEYVMLKDINDRAPHAYELVALLQQYKIRAKLNLIPFNPFSGTNFVSSNARTIAAFQSILSEAYITTVRETRGDDIDAACGQLAVNGSDLSITTEGRDHDN